MKRLIPLLLAPLGLLLLALALASPGRAAILQRTDINPALTYYQALAVLPDLSESDHRHLAAPDEWQGRALDSKFEELIGRYDNTFRLLRQATRAQVPCDWGLDVSAGPELLLPSLAKTKGVAQAARLRVMWHLRHGRPAEARDDFLAAFVLGRNVSKDGLVISALVQFAIDGILANTVAENIFEFTPETLDQIQAGIDAGPTRGTIRDCMKIERATSGDWFIAKIKGFQAETPGDEAAVMIKVRELFGRTLYGGDQPDPGLPERLITSTGGTSAGLVAGLQELHPLYDEMTALLGLPYEQFAPAAKAFEARLAQNSNPLAGPATSKAPSGVLETRLPLASTFIPAMSKARAKEFMNQVKMAQLRAGIEYRCHRDDRFRNVPDPCGSGPFTVERLVIGNSDRGFLLKSKLNSRGFNEVLVFADKNGTPVFIDGPRAGQPIVKEPATK